MIVLNFAHPLTEQQKAQIDALTKQETQQVIDITVKFDNEKPFEAQLQELTAKIKLTSDEWQTQPILVNLPSLNTIAALLLSELHGRMGYFPPVLRLRPTANTTPTQFEVAEIINLQNVRNVARSNR